MKNIFFGKKKKDNRKLSPFYNIGFHGDEYLIKIVFQAISVSEQFIETGTNVGSTLSYVAKNFTNVQCYSCEPHNESYKEALKNSKGLNNVILKNELSPEFLYNLNKIKLYSDQKVTAFWLDSHGHGFKWPLREEIKFITETFNSAFIFIDDFKVPGGEQFGYDEYNEQICSMDYIKNYFEKGRDYKVIYPNYTERTSSYHPLRGWVLIEYGDNNFKFPEGLIDKVRTVKLEL